MSEARLALARHRRPAPRRRSGARGASVGLLLAAALLAGCASGDDEAPAYVERSVGELYNTAMNQLEAGENAQAANLFDEVERQHPYSVWASKAQLMAAYAHYLENNYEDAINTLNRFIELHPGNRDIAYAHYLKGLSYYERISDVRRDQEMTTKARESFQELVKRFPESKYARDARLKLDLTENHLAGKEMVVGRYYLENGNYLAAIGRFRTVIERHQTTSHVPEALHRLVESYLALGVVEEARATAAVLGHNFPGSEWYQDSYALLNDQGLKPAEAPEAESPSWLAEVWDSVS